MLQMLESVQDSSSEFSDAEFDGNFGMFGGAYVNKDLSAALDHLKEAFLQTYADPAFQDELRSLQKTWIGRPTPLLYAENATRILGGAKVYVKMEGLAHTGAHKINNALGQALLAKRMGKKRIIAETGAGQHGLASAAACAKMGLSCRVYMGAHDVARQRPNVYAMELMGAEVVAVETGDKGLKDAVDAALLDYARTYRDTHYLLGSAVGPAPYPDMVRMFQTVIGEETKRQAREAGEVIYAMLACVGGGSNSIGFFSPFLQSPHPRLIAVEAGGRGPGLGDNAIRMSGPARTGVAHGYKSRFIMNDREEIQPTHSISAGLDYPGIGPQLADLGVRGRVEFTSASDAEALAAVKFFAQHEGVLFALESAHAGAAAIRLAPTLSPDKALVVNMSGRGDKDLFITAPVFDGKKWFDFLRGEAERGDMVF